jgi:type I restriction enzyme S subunit
MDWRMNKVKLSSIIDIISGGTPKTDVKQFWEKGTIGWLSVTDFNNDLRYVYSTEKQITDEGLKNSNTKLLNIGDIIISARGTVGALAQIGTPMCFNQSCFGLRGKNGIVETDYLYYALKNYVLNIKKRSQGSVFDTINLNSFDLMEIEIPKDLKDQNKIASVLSTLDSKIELNNRINAELEAMAKTLYDYWFVQFDFPDKNGKPYKTSGGTLIWNEELKREIPEGWDSGDLKDIANITMGQSPPGESYNEEGNGMIFYQGCTDFGNRFPTVRKFTTEPTRFAKVGDILLSVRAPVGTLNIAKEDCCIGRGLASLNSKDNCIGYLFGVMVNLKQIFDRRNVNGTTFGSITKDDLFSLKVVMPTINILEKYHIVINSSFEKQNQLEFENIKLTELSDWLSPMLMNGQVKVN